MLKNFRDGSAVEKKVPEIDPGILDSKRLQLFYAAAKEGGFALAAHALSLSPSAVSHSVKVLEEELGCSLFRRSGPHVTLTRAGARLFPMVEELLVSMSRIKVELDGGGGRSENLTFTLDPSLLDIVNTGILPVFRECFPGSRIGISFSENYPSTGVVDFHMGYEEHDGTNLVRRDLAEESLVACVAPFHPLANKPQGKASDLMQSLLIFSSRDTHDQMMKRISREGRVPPCWILPTPEITMEMARQGQGIAFLPNWLALPAIGAGSLVMLKTPGSLGKRKCSAYWKPEKPLSWVADAFLSLLSVEFEKRLDPLQG